MAFNQNAVLLGPYTRKQKLYLETDDGVAMEGEFVKFNASKTSILLHHVELVPSDGRTFEQFNAILSELICLRPLGNSKAISDSSGSDGAEKPAPVTIATEKPPQVTETNAKPENYNDLILPEIDNSVEAREERAKKFAARKSGFIQKLIEAGIMKNNTSEAESKKSSSAKPVEVSPPISPEISAEETKKVVDERTNTNIVKDDFKEPEKLNNLNAQEEMVSNGMYEALKSKAKGYIIIDKPGPLLQSAMQDIEKRSVIGVNGHGANQGRLNRLSILSIVTESGVYLFDVHLLGKQVLNQTLAKALESKTIEKVTYDCRYLSDCLYHSHDIRMQNVYDIQAADCVMYRCRKGVFSGRARGLQEIVSHYLDLPAALLADKTNITNYKVWYQRPLEEHCYSFAAWQVVFLPQLRTAVDKAFQNLMLNSMDVYVSYIRKMPRPEAIEALTHRRRIPVELMGAPFDSDP